MINFLRKIKLSSKKNKLIALYNENDKDLDILVHDKDMFIRIGVAQIGRDKDLDILVNDPIASVRYEVASKGRLKDLYILVNDRCNSVAANAKKHLSN